MKTTLRCTKCGEIFETEDTVSLNGLPPCSDCGAPLTIPGKLEIACCSCDFRKTVEDVDCDEYPQCPQCDWQVVVLSQEYKGKLESSLVEESEDNEAPVRQETSSPQPSAPSDSGETLLLEKIKGKEAAEIAQELKQANPWEEDPAAYSQKAGLTSRTFGKYNIIEEIARGGMGIVYKVEDKDLGRQLALKVLIAGEDASEDLLKRFLREARSAAQLNHPNVIPIHDVGQVKGQYYFTMDFIAGPAFDKIIAGKWMTHEEILSHMRDIAEALAIAHEAGIIHRDIKPANIMYDVQNKRALLTDFGLAKDLDSNTMLSMSGMMMGSPAYMSPEQAKGLVHNIDQRSDIYSLGVVLFEAVTGEQPFQGNTVVETVRKVVFEDPVPPRQLAPDTVGKDLENIILKCMEKDPDERYQSMSELVGDLNSYLEGGKVAAKAQPVFRTAWRKLRKKPVMLGLVLSLPFVMAGTLTAVWFVFFAPGFLDDAEKEIKSNQPQRQSSIITQMASRIKDGKLSSEKDRKKLMPLLLYCLDSRDENVVSQACLLLELSTFTEAVQPLSAALADSTRSEKSRLAILAALRATGSRESSDKALAAKALMALARNKSEPRDLRIGAVRALEDVWHAEAKQQLLDIAKDKTDDPDIRAAALGTCGAKMNLASPEMNVILVLYGDPEEKVSSAARSALQATRDKTSIYDLYGIKDTAASVSSQLGNVIAAQAQRQQELIEMARDIDGPEKKVVKPVEAISSRLKDPSPDVRVAAAYDLGQLGDGEALPLLVAALPNDDPDFTAVCARSIIALSEKAKPQAGSIAALLDDQRPHVREEAVFIIFSTGDTTAYESVVSIAPKENNMRVIRRIAELLPRVNSDQALPLLKIMLEKTENTNIPVAVLCVQSMAAFGELAVPYLKEFAESKNMNVRNEVLNTLRSLR